MIDGDVGGDPGGIGFLDVAGNADAEAGPPEVVPENITKESLP